MSVAAPPDSARNAGLQREGVAVRALPARSAPGERPARPATTWLLLRGLARGSGHWAGFDELCRATWPDARILTLDVPGNGARWVERSPSQVSAMTEALRAELRATVGPQGAGRLHLLSVSMGGMIAADWASRYPQEVATAVLVNSSARPLSPWWQRLRPAALRQLTALALRGAGPEAWERAILALTSCPAERHAAVLAAWTGLREQQPVSLRNLLRQLRAAARWRAPLRAPTVPTLLLSGLADRLVDPRCSEALARQWGCLLLSHPDAGHDLTLDDGTWVLAQVQAWMRSGDVSQV